MTLRARPVARRSKRPTGDGDQRRALLVNLGFGFVIVLAVVILGGAVAANYYSDHFAPVASVNGATISKDAYRARIAIDLWRYDQAESSVRELLNEGLLEQSEAQQRIALIQQQKQQVDASTILEDLIDQSLILQLGAQRGINVTEQQVDEQIRKDASRPELRRASMISVKPAVDTNATEPTAQQLADARAKAEKALADLKSGTPFQDVAKSVSTDSYAEGGGDVGYLTADSTSIDKDLVTALFALPEGGTTEIVQGTDKTFRIGRVNKISPAKTDDTYLQKVADAKLDVGAYREAVKASVVRQTITDQLVGELVDKPSPQRKVQQIWIGDDPTNPATESETKVRHILYSPNGDPSKASEVKQDDPAWQAAKDKAQAAFDKIKSGSATFADLAKAESDDKGSGADGGELGWIKRSDLDPAFGEAVFKEGLKAGDLIGPIKSSFGWHVIEFEDRRLQPSLRIAQAKDEIDQPNADFAAVAKKYSESANAATSPDLGWVARNQLELSLEEAIFALQPGQTSGIILGSDGYYIFKVVEAADRLPDPTQATTLKSNVFPNWYTAQKALATIDRSLDQSTLGQGG